jgi:hypothetical protein
LCSNFSDCFIGTVIKLSDLSISHLLILSLAKDWQNLGDFEFAVLSLFHQLTFLLSVFYLEDSWHVSVHIFVKNFEIFETFHSILLSRFGYVLD